LLPFFGKKVECCFDKVERCFDIVSGVDGASVVACRAAWVSIRS